MEATISYPYRFRFHQYPISPIQAHQICQKQRMNPRLTRCAKSGSVPEMDKKLEQELKRLSTKDCCQEINGGIVELVECLEKEAIMGEDKGKEASDYHRRAHIFDQSSKVFQALKDQTN